MQHKSRLYDKRNLYLMYLHYSSIKLLFQECNARRLSQIISMNNKAIERDVRLCLRAIHINGTFQNHAENTDNYLYEIGEKVTLELGQFSKK